MDELFIAEVAVPAQLYRRLGQQLTRTTKTRYQPTSVQCGSGGFRSIKVRSGCVLLRAANRLTHRERTPCESVTRMAETLTGRIIDLDGEVFHLETDQGERIMFTLLAASGIQPHDLEGIVRSPVRIEVTIDGPHEHATATRVGPTEQFHPRPPPPPRLLR